MKLKHYQEKVLTLLKGYLSELVMAKQEFDELLNIKPSLAKHVNFPQVAWDKVSNKTYISKRNGLDEPLPDIYLKVPTGGGKTLLACHSIDLIQKIYLSKQTGLVLWIVPSTQIYRQTISALKDRNHSYRQILDISSGGRTLIKEKGNIFDRLDIEENLVIMLLMLPSANRENKETLKVFKDSGGYTDFFPNEDNFDAQKALVELFPNLDCFNTENEIFNIQIKTSLGNTLKVLKPLVVIDEGHKAYAENARKTIQNFNPSFVLELSATPPPNSNELVKITGRELHEEEMIKLDIHLVNKSSLAWQDTILATLEKLNELESQARIYESNTGKYIRPASLIQVERTGKDQRDSKFIHAEDVKEFLIKKCSVPENQIAIKSSEKDDIEGIDLFASDCSIRFIITKQALQEGWDFSFAYILTILTNPSSTTGITQLVGRILRQPFAKKTLIRQLDECYVYTFKQNASKLVKEIKTGLEKEGLGDIVGRIVSDETSDRDELFKEVDAHYRPGFKKFDGKIFLPKFVIQESSSMWRDINFEADILSQIDFEKIDLSEIDSLILNPNQTMGELDLTMGYPEEILDVIIQRGQTHNKGTLTVDEAFLARQLGSLIPNPWIAYAKGNEAIALIKDKYKDHENKSIVESNFVFIIEYLKKIIEKQTDQLAEAVFKGLIDNNRIFFFLLEESGHHLLPSRIKVKGTKELVREDNSTIQKSLFDQVFEEEFNETEKSVAIYLDRQEKLLWWYRNRSRQDYHIQGWRKNKIYPDFIAADSNPISNEYDKVFVLETKGVHLKENNDTRYKENVFDLCNRLGSQKPWKELFNEFPDHNFEFQVVFEDEWQNKLNQLMV